MSAVEGFKFAAVAAGIGTKERLDFTVAVLPEGCAVAATFTRNTMRAAPVELAAQRLSDGTTAPRAIVVNSGNANACTGDVGVRDALNVCSIVENAMHLSNGSVIPASTGVIGVPLPMDVIRNAASQLTKTLEDDADGFSRAILTTDQGPKIATADCGDATILGIAKGAGMIHPNMATMLAFVFTDANIDAARLQELTTAAVDASFNRITVDGDTSTNDAVFVCASGKQDVEEAAFETALFDVMARLAQQIVMDGEGAEHCVTIRVNGAESDDDATAIANTVATSNLVKTALFGCDPNWGRIAGAIGRSGVAVELSQLTISIGAQKVLNKGVVVMDAAAEKVASTAMNDAFYQITIRVGDGPGSGWKMTSDLGHNYVSLNAAYRS